MLSVVLMLRRMLGAISVGFVKLRAEQSATRHARLDERRARRHKDDPPEMPAG